MKRKPQQVSLEPYGYTLVRRAPVKSPEIKSEVAEQKEVAPAPSPIIGISTGNDPEEDTQGSTRKSGKSAGCFASFIVIALVFIVLAALTSQSSGTNGSSYSSSNHDAGMACVMAEKLIKQQLKAPSSAEFDYADCKNSATHNGNTWTLRSYVDADNSFGAHIRNRYVAKLTNVPPSDTWRLVELSLD